MPKKRITPLSAEVDKRLYIKGITRNELATKIGISRSYISLVLTGEVLIPIPISTKIAEELDMDDCELRKLALKKAM
jgi:transcriptional regulator with XRE-family HTH domain